MSKKIKVSVEFKNLLESAVAYYEAKTELSETRKKYGDILNGWDALVRKMDALRMKLVVENGMSWAEACHQKVTVIDEDTGESKVIDLSPEVYAMAVQKKEDAETELVERCKPISQKVNAYANSIATIEGLYDSYVIAMQKGDWDATGFYRTGRDKLINVNTSFRDSIIAVMRKYGCGINAKSGRTCEDTIFVRLGGKSGKEGFQALTKRQFVNLFVDCVLQYMIDTKQL